MDCIESLRVEGREGEGREDGRGPAVDVSEM
jgi:hypothetical protein